jgi:transglutaminase-like putative cysteine protease
MRVYNIRSLDDRIKHLKRLAIEGKVDPAIHAFVREATSKRCGDDWCIREKDNLSEARAIFDATRKRVRYTSDIAGVDTYQKPAHTLALRSADCDDFSSLLCSALLSVGIPCRFKVIRTVNGDSWNHIYVQAGFPRAQPKKWVTLDASVPAAFGWEAPSRMIADQRIFPVG